MPTEALSETIKTRVPPWVKRQFKRIARERHLDAADIQRAALREYLDRNKTTPETTDPPEANGQKAVAA